MRIAQYLWLAARRPQSRTRHGSLGRALEVVPRVRCNELWERSLAPHGASVSARSARANARTQTWPSITWSIRRSVSKRASLVTKR